MSDARKRKLYDVADRIILTKRFEELASDVLPSEAFPGDENYRMYG